MSADTALATGESQHIAVVIPCYQEKDNIDQVLSEIPPLVRSIIVVDDACPEATGEHVKSTCKDPRVQVITHSENQGVGGALVSGYRAALAVGADIIVKVDGDGQMHPGQIPALISPIIGARADYAKGNRFHRIEDTTAMPLVRLLGNATLSFMSKLSTGYWQIFDPTNGFTAIHRNVLMNLPLDKIDRSFFFESDMLFRLNISRAVVIDVPMRARYANEKSKLRPANLIGAFLLKHTRNFGKRIFYNYFLRDFHVASLEWLLGAPMMAFGVWFGSTRWLDATSSGEPATAGTVMLAALPVLIGLQLLLSALQFDVANQPRVPVHPLLADKTSDKPSGQ